MIYPTPKLSVRKHYLDIEVAEKGGHQILSETKFFTVGKAKYLRNEILKAIFVEFCLLLQYRENLNTGKRDHNKRNHAWTYECLQCTYTSSFIIYYFKKYLKNIPILLTILLHIVNSTNATDSFVFF